MTAAVAVLAAGCSGSGTNIEDGPGGSGATSGSSANDALYAAPTGKATPGSIYGVWGGTVQDLGTTFDTRLKMSATSVTAAARCTTSDGKHSGTVGVTAAARISQTEITLLESKEDQKDDGVVKCGVTLAPKDLKLCGTDMPPGFEQSCFTLKDMTMVQYGMTPLDKLELTKLSD